MKRIFRVPADYIVAAAACLYAFTVGAFSPRHRALWRRIREHFGPVRKRAAMEEPLVPRIAVEDVAPSDTDIRILEPSDVNGNLSLTELIVIARIARRLAPLRCFEIGTFDGRTTLNIAANTPADAIVHTLDLPRAKIGRTRHNLVPGESRYADKPQSGARFAGTKYNGKIRQLLDDSATFDFSPYADSMDLVFVDGSHAYEYALNDTRAALGMARKKQGVILWHDYAAPCWPDVTSALDKLYREDRRLRTLRWIEGTRLAFWSETGTL